MCYVFVVFEGLHILILMTFNENQRLFMTPRVKLQGLMLVCRLGTLCVGIFTVFLMSSYNIGHVFNVVME